MDQQIQKGILLFSQNRYKEAKQVFSDLLAQDPNNPYVLQYLAEIEIQFDELKKADQLIDSAIQIQPDNGDNYYIKSRIKVGQSHYNEAEKLLETAISIDPVDADYHAFLAHIYLQRKRYKDALEVANKALEYDAENIMAINVRSTALLKLNKTDESYSTIETALKEDPNNSYTHANFGWNLLEKGDDKKALHHFEEALKNDPNNHYAQAGMVEALKSKYLIYKWILQFQFWMGNLTAKFQWGFIIAFYLGFRFLRTIAQNNEALRPFLTPLIILIAVFAFSTWVIGPISNLFLRLNKYGKHLLTKEEIRSSNFVGISLLIFIVGIIAYVATKQDRYLSIIIFGFAMMIPLSLMFTPSKYKNAFLYYAIAMAAIGLLAIATTFSTGELFNTFATVFLIGFIAFQWIANFLIIKETNI